MYKDADGNMVAEGSKTTYHEADKKGNILGDYKGSPNDLEANTRKKGGFVSEALRKTHETRSNELSGVSSNETVDGSGNVSKDLKNPEQKKSTSDTADNSDKKIHDNSLDLDSKESIPKSGQTSNGTQSKMMQALESKSLENADLVKSGDMSYKVYNSRNGMG